MSFGGIALKMSTRTVSITAGLVVLCVTALLAVLQSESAQDRIGVTLVGVTQADFGEVMGHGCGPTDWLVVSIVNTGSRTVTLAQTSVERMTEGGWNTMRVHTTPVRGCRLRPRQSATLKLEALSGTEPRRIAIQYYVCASPTEWLSVRLRDVWSSGRLSWLTRPVVRSVWATNTYRIHGSEVVELASPP